MTDRQLTDGSPVPDDHSHTKLLPNGQQKGYVVLTPEERAKGFVKPVRRTYVHHACGCQTTMGIALAETYARDPNFYTGTFCCVCARHFSLTQFDWLDGEPMHPPSQAAWAEEKRRKGIAARRKQIEELRQQLADLEEQERVSGNGSDGR